MVKPVAKAEINSFVKGLITEASPLNFPPNASRDEQNFVLNTDGTRDRRLGLDFEADYTLRSTSLTPEALLTAATSSFRWESAGNNSTNEFVVVQFGAKLDVYSITTAAISTDGYIGTVTLTGVTGTEKFSYASIDGTLVIAAGTEEVHVINYNDPDLVYTTVRLLVRDLWGLPGLDNNEINSRPSTLSNAHLYNLRNQGWGIPRKNSAGTLSDPVGIFYSNYSKYPSNTEVVYAGLQFQPVSAGTPFERIYPNLYDEVLGLDSPAAKGYFIIDALRRGTSRAAAFEANRVKFPTLTANITAIPSDITYGGARVVADYAGRVFYAGFGGEVTDGDVNSPILSSYVLFSQVIKGTNDVVKCYQHGDPTSRENSDLLDTDGGFIRISGVKKIFGMEALSGHLFVLADNGIWRITGGSDYGFSATNYSVNKVSSFGCNNTNSVVVVNDQIFFWGESGIFVLLRNQYGDWVVQSISEGTIQTLFDEIDTTDRESVTGIYDSSDKKIRWMYNQDTNTSNSNTVFEINLDIQLNAFSINRFYNLATNSPEVISYIASASFLSGGSESSVVVDGELVDSNGIQVVVDTPIRTSGLQAIKYVTLYGLVGAHVGYSFAQYKDTTFRDWKSVDDVGVDAKAYVLTGAITAGDSAIFKQSPYLIMHFLKTELGVELSGGSLIPSNPSSCLMRSQWDWSTSVTSGKWSEATQAYRYRKPFFISETDDIYDNGFEVVTSKNKLRGRGRALSLYLETEPDKDCRILGWSLSLTGNSLS